MEVAERLPSPAASRWGGETLRRHAGLVAVVGLAALVRLATEVAYRPALFFDDSWTYVVYAYDRALNRFPGDRPAGYPLFLNAADAFGRSITSVVTLQHLAGLATGVLVYFLLLRLGTRRRWATLGAAIVLLDGYAIALEQYVMPEALFTLALTVSVFLVTVARPTPASLAASGFLLAASISLRTMGLFAVPVWLAYLALKRVPRRSFAAGAAALLIPLLAYASAQASAGEGFSVVPPGNGWFLYGRIGPIADCRGIDVPASERPLCVDSRTRERHTRPDFYVWKAGSPANRAFGYVNRDPVHLEGPNRTIRSFALRIARHRPLAYGSATALDFARFFAPEVASERPDDGPIRLPVDLQHRFPGFHAQARFFPDYDPRAHPPAALVRSYRGVVHTPRWLMALFALAGLALLPVGRRNRGRAVLPRRREALFLTGTALVMLLGAAATTNFNVRYVVALVPLFTAGGVLAIEDLWALPAARERRIV
ncbi:MAG: phospholipid carrier-dependent glycosyltransferase [Thermoleophilaceae bacterium]